MQISRRKSNAYQNCSTTKKAVPIYARILCANILTCNLRKTDSWSFWLKRGHWLPNRLSSTQCQENDKVGEASWRIFHLGKHLRVAHRHFQRLMWFNGPKSGSGHAMERICPFAHWVGTDRKSNEKSLKCFTKDQRIGNPSWLYGSRTIWSSNWNWVGVNTARGRLKVSS